MQNLPIAYYMQNLPIAHKYIGHNNQQVFLNNCNANYYGVNYYGANYYHANYYGANYYGATDHEYNTFIANQYYHCIQSEQSFFEKINWDDQKLVKVICDLYFHQKNKSNYQNVYNYILYRLLEGYSLFVNKLYFSKISSNPVKYWKILSNDNKFCGYIYGCLHQYSFLTNSLLDILGSTNVVAIESDVDKIKGIINYYKIKSDNVHHDLIEDYYKKISVELETSDEIRLADYFSLKNKRILKMECTNINHNSLSIFKQHNLKNKITPFEVSNNIVSLSNSLDQIRLTLKISNCSEQFTNYNKTRECDWSKLFLPMLLTDTLTIVTGIYHVPGIVDILTANGYRIDEYEC